MMEKCENMLCERVLPPIKMARHPTAAILHAIPKKLSLESIPTNTACTRQWDSIWIECSQNPTRQDAQKVDSLARS